MKVAPQPIVAATTTTTTTNTTITTTTHTATTTQTTRTTPGKITTTMGEATVATPAFTWDVDAGERDSHGVRDDGPSAPSTTDHTPIDSGGSHDSSTLSHQASAVKSANKSGAERMISAIWADDPKKVLAVLMLSPLLNASVNVKKNTSPLQLATRIGAPKVLNFLLEHPDIEPNRTDNEGWTALHEAARNGNATAVARLLAAPKIRMHLPLPSGATPFHVAVENGKLPVAQVLLQQERSRPSARTSQINRTLSNGQSPLHIACRMDHPEVVQWLLAQPEILQRNGQPRDLSAVLAMKTKTGETPLLLAAQAGRVDTAKLLLKNGARLDVCTEDGFSALHLAAQSGHTDMVRWLLKASTLRQEDGTRRKLSHVLNQSSDEGWTPLHLAVRSGKIGVVDLLLAQPRILLNKADDMGHTPLHAAAEHQQLDIAARLLRHPKTQVNRLTWYKVSPFLLAITNNDLPMAQLLLSHKAAINEPTADGLRPLHAACSEHNLEMVQWLLKQPDILRCKGQTVGMPEVLNHTTEHGVSPLQCALDDSGKAMAVVAFLLAQPGIDVESPTSRNNTLLCLAAEKGLTNMVIVLLAEPAFKGKAGSSANRAAFFSALVEGHLNIAQWLFRHGADVHRKNERGVAPLQLACRSGKLAVVQWLLTQLSLPQPDGLPRDLPAILNATDTSGATALHAAAHKGHAQIVQFLLAQPGIDPCPKKNEGETPLHMAAANGQYDAVAALLRHRPGAIDLQDADGETALHGAIFNGQIAVFELLLDHGADINLPAMDGYTPLHVACEKGDLGFVRVLLKRPDIRLLNGKPRGMPAVLNQTTASGETLLYVAARQGRVNVVRFLLDQEDIDPNLADAQGVTPLQAARRHKHPEVERLLRAFG